MGRALAHACWQQKVVLCMLLNLNRVPRICRTYHWEPPCRTRVVCADDTARHPAWYHHLSSCGLLQLQVKSLMVSRKRKFWPVWQQILILQYMRMLSGCVRTLVIPCCSCARCTSIPGEWPNSNKTALLPYPEIHKKNFITPSTTS